MKKKIAVDEMLKNILERDGASTQEEICNKLAHLGIEITQSSVSRWLRKIQAVKISTNKGASYVLPKAQSLPNMQLALSVAHNATMIVVRTAPGSASLLAALIDQSFTGKILGTLAGDDTIFITPVDETCITALAKELEIFLHVL